MVRKSAAVFIVCLIAEQIEKLCVHDGYNKIEGVIGIGDDDEHCRLTISQHIKLHFVIAHQLPKLLYVKRRKSRTAGDKDRFCCFACGELVFLILSHRKVIGFLRFQFLKEQVNCVLKFLVILSRFGSVDKFK